MAGRSIIHTRYVSLTSAGYQARPHFLKEFNKYYTYHTSINHSLRRFFLSEAQNNFNIFVIFLLQKKFLENIWRILDQIPTHYSPSVS